MASPEKLAVEKTLHGVNLLVLWGDAAASGAGVARAACPLMSPTIILGLWSSTGATSSFEVDAWSDAKHL